MILAIVIRIEEGSKEFIFGYSHWIWKQTPAFRGHWINKHESFDNGE